MVSVDLIAKWFLRRMELEDPDDGLTNLKLQKLLYYAQGIWMAKKGTELFKADFERWQHGPVIERVYRQYADAGRGMIEVKTEEVRLDPEIEEVLEFVWQNLAIYSPEFLRNLTLDELEVMEIERNEIVDKEKMKKFFTFRFGSDFPSILPDVTNIIPDSQALGQFLIAETISVLLNDDEGFNFAFWNDRRVAWLNEKEMKWANLIMTCFSVGMSNRNRANRIITRYPVKIVHQTLRYPLDWVMERFGFESEAEAVSAFERMKYLLKKCGLALYGKYPSKFNEMYRDPSGNFCFDIQFAMADMSAKPA